MVNIVLKSNLFLYLSELQHNAFEHVAPQVSMRCTLRRSKSGSFSCTLAAVEVYSGTHLQFRGLLIALPRPVVVIN